MGKLHGTNIDGVKPAVNVLIVDEVDSDKVTIERRALQNGMWAGLLKIHSSFECVRYYSYFPCCCGQMPNGKNPNN